MKKRITLEIQCRATQHRAAAQCLVAAAIVLTQRRAIEPEAKLASVETAHRDAIRQLIGTNDIGQLEVDAWQLFERPERSRNGNERCDIGLADSLNLTRGDGYTSSI